MARLENGSYDEFVAHLERELDLNALEESDELPMATMISSTCKQKNLFSNGLSSNIVCNYCKEKCHMVKNFEKFKKKRKMPKKANGLTRRFTLSVELVARRITLRNDVGKAHARFSSLNVTGLKSHRILRRTPTHKNRNMNQHRPTPSPRKNN